MLGPNISGNMPYISNHEYYKNNLVTHQSLSWQCFEQSRATLCTSNYVSTNVNIVLDASKSSNLYTNTGRLRQKSLIFDYVIKT